MTDKDSSAHADIKEVKADVKEVKADVKEVKGNVTAGMEKAELPLDAGGEHVRPLTTAEDDRKTEGQRRVNLIWETTQAVVAIMVTGATIWSALSEKESLILGNAFTLIIALYFVRQNHSRVGGVGGDSAGGSR